MKLYGIAVSNYYNIVKHALLVKGIDFEEIASRPSQETDYLVKSPLGKIPCLETEQGFLAEANVMIEYIDERFPAKPLLPSDPWQRAKTRELIKITELYIEAPAHRHVGEVLFGEPRNQAVYDEVRPQLEKGLRALRQLISLSPYAAGSEMTAADIFILHTFSLASQLIQSVYHWDIIAEVPGLEALLDKLNSTEVGQQVQNDRIQATQALMKQLNQ